MTATATHIDTATSKLNSRLRTFHKVSAMILVSFASLHIINHLSGVFGIEAYNSVQRVLRYLYRNIIVEPILLTIISAQLVVGITLLVKSLRRGRPRGFWAWTQVLSGGIFFYCMVEHLLALAAVRLGFELDTNFYWPASVMNGPPFIYYFVPYYFLLIWSVMAHAGVGLRYLLIDAGQPVLGQRVGVGMIIAGALAGATIVASLGQVFYPIELPKEWADYNQYFLEGEQL